MIILGWFAQGGALHNLGKCGMINVGKRKIVASLLVVREYLLEELVKRQLIIRWFY